MAKQDDLFPRQESWWRRNIRETQSPEEARQRLDAILSDRLLWFNPYRVADGDLLACAERGRWLPFPAMTQMLVFHFLDIRRVTRNDPALRVYDGLFFNIGNSDEEHHFGIRSMTAPLTHKITRQPVWTLVNCKHLVNSDIAGLQGKSLFVSHAIGCHTRSGQTRMAYRMHRLYGPESRRADVVRRSMCAAKLAMLEEIIRYPYHPDYLGCACDTFDYRTPLLRAADTISRFPSSLPPTTH